VPQARAPSTDQAGIHNELINAAVGREDQEGGFLDPVGQQDRTQEKIDPPRRP